MPRTRRTVVWGLAAVYALLLACAAGAAQPPADNENREIVSPTQTISQRMTALQCGTQTVQRADGSTTEVPREGNFAVRCRTVTLVDRYERILSTRNHCDAPKFVGC